MQNQFAASGITTVRQTGSNFTTTSTTATNFLTLKNLSANTNYSFDCHLVYQSSVTTAGLGIAMTGPASPTAVMYAPWAFTAATAVAGQQSATSFGTSITISTTVNNSITDFEAFVFGSVENGANTGNLVLQVYASSAATITIKRGSFCSVRY